MMVDICRNSVFVSAKAQFKRCGLPGPYSSFSRGRFSGLQSPYREIGKFLGRGAPRLLQALRDDLRMTDRNHGSEKAAGHGVGIAIGELAVPDPLLDHHGDDVGDAI